MYYKDPFDNNPFFPLRLSFIRKQACQKHSILRYFPGTKQGVSAVLRSSHATHLAMPNVFHERLAPIIYSNDLRKKLVLMHWLLSKRLLKRNVNCSRCAHRMNIIVYRRKPARYLFLAIKKDEKGCFVTTSMIGLTGNATDVD